MARKAAYIHNGLVKAGTRVTPSKAQNLLLALK